jgi:hypothetical protein
VTDPLEDVAALSLDQRRAVCRWVEDRFVNAIQPLALRLQRESPVNMGCDETLQVAQRAVEHVMEHVNEIRQAAGMRVDPRWEGGSGNQGSVVSGQ